MAENKARKLPEFDSLDELVEFFDARDLGEFEEDLPEARFDVKLQKRKYLVSIDEETNQDLTAIAERESTTAEALVNSWLKEKISSYAEQR
jgi:hypothetical protein